MHIIVIGCGRLGSYLARSLSDLGHDVCIIDRDGKKLSVLGNGFNGKRIEGIEFDSDNLAEADIRQADALLAVASDDNINITISLIAKKIYHIPKIIARVNDPNRQYIYRMLDIDVINPIRLGADLLINRLRSPSPSVVLVEKPEYCILEIFVTKGKAESIEKIQKKFFCIVSAVIRRGKMSLPKPEDEVRYGDKIVCTVHNQQREKLLNFLSREDVIWDPS